MPSSDKPKKDELAEIVSKLRNNKQKWRRKGHKSIFDEEGKFVDALNKGVEQESSEDEKKPD